MTLFSYEIFDAVARQGSFNNAAQQLHLTPSAISHAIAVMEEELGFALFNRGKNGVSMTSYGASLYPSIRDVLNSDEALKQSIANRGVQGCTVAGHGYAVLAAVEQSKSQLLLHYGNEMCIRDSNYLFFDSIKMQ